MVQAVIIMLYEMFAIFIALEMTATKAWYIYIRQYDQGRKNVIVRPPFLVVLLIFCVLVGIYLTNQNILGRIFYGSRGDQIIPLVGQSGIFFSCVLAPLLSCFSVFLIRVTDKKYVETTSYMKYIWGFVAVWFGLETILNMTINLSWLYIRILPMFATFWLIEKISPKQIEE